MTTEVSVDVGVLIGVSSDGMLFPIMCFVAALCCGCFVVGVVCGSVLDCKRG